MNNKTFNWEETKQLTMIQLLLAIFIPSGIAFVGFRIVLPKIVASGVSSLVAWSAVASIMLLLFVIVTIYLLNKEAKELNITLKERMCFKRLTVKEWIKYCIILVVALAVASGTIVVCKVLTEVPFLSVPEYFPFFLDPNVDALNSAPELLTPGFTLKGAYELIPLLAVTLFLNILTEELYFRAWLLPKMSKIKKGFVVNGILFGFYHTFQLWMLPQIIVASLFFAYVVDKSKSIIPGFVFHLVANALNLVAVVYFIVG